MESREISPLRKLQLTELELFRQVAAFMEEHHITYYALCGTLLGAVRHNGFIPWDDDMDLGIPRADYERFLKLCGTQDLPFEMHHFTNDPAHYRYNIRIEDPSVTVIRSNHILEERSSAWIDLFPLDGMPNNPVLRFIWKYYLLWRRAAYRFSCFDRAVDINRKGRPLIERVLIKAGQLLPVQKLFSHRNELKKLDRALKRYSYAKSDYLINAMGGWKLKEMFPKRIFEPGRWYEFENTQIHGPRDYDFVCKQLYGDYLTPPETGKRNHHAANAIIYGK